MANTPKYKLYIWEEVLGAAIFAFAKSPEHAWELLLDKHPIAAEFLFNNPKEISAPSAFVVGFYDNK